MTCYHLVQSRAEMASGLESVQRACFPSLSADELITAAQYRAHTEIFPEGQLAIVTEAGQPVACSTDLICKIDFAHYQHRYLEAVGQNWLTTHDPQGDWLYGADIGVHPDHRRKGLSTRLYEARHNLVKKLNLKGHVAGGYLRNYGAVCTEMSAEDYVARVVAGDIFDATLSIQLKRGYIVHGILENYLEDPDCANMAALIVWHNPDYTG